MMDFFHDYYNFFEFTNPSTEVIVSNFSFALYLFRSKFFRPTSIELNTDSNKYWNDKTVRKSFKNIAAG